MFHRSNLAGHAAHYLSNFFIQFSNTRLASVVFYYFCNVVLGMESDFYQCHDFRALWNKVTMGYFNFLL